MDQVAQQAEAGHAMADVPEVVVGKFEHLSLDLRFARIRLMRLLPSSVSTDPIRCEVFQANLNTSLAPRYQGM